MKKAPTHDQASGAYSEQLSFLPPPPFCPTWPTKGTLADTALGMFLEAKTLDHPDFELATGSWRLAAVVFQLRLLDWPIETIEIPAPTEENPRRKIALYKLPGKYISLALELLKGGKGAAE